MGDANEHRPVLLDAVIEALRIQPDGVYVDATFGRGGHAEAILARLDRNGRLIVVDQDPAAVAVAHRKLDGDERVSIERASFAELRQIARRQGVEGAVNGLLLDLGVASPQLDEPARGFSFRHEGPLDMRMDPGRGEPASAWLARAPEREIADVLKTYGEERFAKRIARAIVARRRVAPLRTTTELAELIAHAVPTREPGKDPATRSFQAIRIHINRELQALEAALEQSLDVLAPGGRLAVISFHSLEDRRVKRFIRDQGRDVHPPDLPVRATAQAPAALRAVGKPVRAGRAEAEANPRARSAVLRAAERAG